MVRLAIGLLIPVLSADWDSAEKIVNNLFDINISSMLLADFTYKICNTEFNSIRVSGFSLIQMV